MIHGSRVALSSAAVELAVAGEVWGVCLSYVSGDTAGLPAVAVAVRARDNRPEPMLLRDGVFYQFTEPVKSVAVLSGNGAAVTVVADVALEPRDFVNESSPPQVAASGPRLQTDIYDLGPQAETQFVGHIQRFTRPSWARYVEVLYGAYRTAGTGGSTTAVNCTGYSVVPIRVYPDAGGPAMSGDPAEYPKDPAVGAGASLLGLAANANAANELGSLMKLLSLSLPALGDYFDLGFQSSGNTVLPLGLASPFHVRFYVRWSN